MAGITILVLVSGLLFAGEARLWQLQGTQERGMGHRDAVLRCNGVTLDTSFTVYRVECSDAGFWLDGPQGMKRFDNPQAAVGLILGKGEWWVYPNLPPKQSTATVTLFITDGTPPAASPAGMPGTPAAPPAPPASTPPPADPGSQPTLPPEQRPPSSIVGKWRFKAGQHTGWLKFDTNSSGQIFYDVIGNWEALSAVQYDRTAGAIAFHRVPYPQDYSGKVTGNSMGGNATGKDNWRSGWSAGREEPLTSPGQPPAATPPPASTPETGPIPPQTPDNARPSGNTGSPVGNHSLVNLAIGKQASQSSVYHGTGVNQSAQRGVDGRRTKDPDDMFHTNADELPWWMVDLGAVHRLQSIRIYNRPHAQTASNANTLTALVSEDGISWRTLYTHNGQDWQTLSIPAAVSARYVKLLLQEAKYFHLMEVEVFGNPGRQ